MAGLTTRAYDCQKWDKRGQQNSITLRSFYSKLQSVKIVIPNWTNLDKNVFFIFVLGCIKNIWGRS